MVTQTFFTILIVVVGLERLIELFVSKRNAAWSFSQGGREFGQSHYPYMVALHTLFLVGMLVEVWLVPRGFVPVAGAVMFTVVLLAQGLRWWVIKTLGPMWNTRVIVVPGLSMVRGGPFRFLKHPNYLAVVIEGIALPLVHNAWITALVFTFCNAAILWVRIKEENIALRQLSGL